MFVCCTTKDQLSNVLDLTLKIYPSSWFYDAPLSYLGLGQVEDLGFTVQDRFDGFQESSILDFRDSLDQMLFKV